MKRTVFCLLALLHAGLFYAETIGRSDAQATARAFLASRGITMQASDAAYRAPRRARGTSSDDAFYYVFNAGNDCGYVIVSGDDRTEPILGYVEQGSFDEESIPENMRAWLQQYAEEIKSLDNNSPIIETVGRIKSRRVKRTRHIIPPLVKSRWNQGDPYNCRCPIYYKDDGTTAQPASGCVATAFAQILNYYKFPEKTVAAIPSLTNTYTLSNGTKKTVTARVITRGTKIDWENMLDVYTSSATDEQRTAVGNLMLYCGQSVGMGYGGSSGAVTSKCATAIVKYFGYDDQAYWVNRSDYDIADWTDMLYEELEGGHPLCYNGHSTGGGHAFVIDGYDGNGLFHVNWGWGGGSDGWFVITSLNSGDNSGIGASSTSDGYTMGQGCLMGVRYPDNGREEPSTSLTINDIKCSGANITANYINWTGGSYNFVAGIVKYNEEKQTYETVGLTQTITGLSPNTYRSLTFNINKRLAPGTYRLSPASRVSTNRTWRPQLDLKRNYILATVDSMNVLTLKYVTPVKSLECDTIVFPGTHSVGVEQPVNVTFHNLADEFYGEMSLFAGKDGTKEYQTSRSAVTVPRDGRSTVSFAFTPEETGTYDVWISSNDGNTDYAHTTLEVLATPQRASLSLASITIQNSSSGTVYSNRLQGTVGIKNQKSDQFDGKVKIQLWVQDANKSNTYWTTQSKTVEMSIAPARTVSAAFNFQNLEYNRNYIISAYYVGQDGALDNGGLITSHQYKPTPGVLYWKNTGAMSCLASRTLFTTSNQAVGVYFSTGGTRFNRISANKVLNTIYAFSADSEVPDFATTLSSVNIVRGNEAEEIHLDNSSAFYSPVNFTAKKAEFSYTFPETTDGQRWESVLLPFTPETIMIDSVVCQLNDEAGHFWIYQFDSLDDSDTPVFQPATHLQGELPYLIAADSTLAGKTVVFSSSDVDFYQTGSLMNIINSDAFTHYGTYLQQSRKNVYQMNAEGTAFVFSSTSKTLPPLTTYFTTTLPDEERPDTIFLPAVPKAIETAIHTVKADVASGEQPVYDMMGRRVGMTVVTDGVAQLRGLKPGVYVIAGRKVFVR